VLLAARICGRQLSLRGLERKLRVSQLLGQGRDDDGVILPGLRGAHAGLREKGEPHVSGNDSGCGRQTEDLNLWVRVKA
jgi:hypothetical protein